MIIFKSDKHSTGISGVLGPYQHGKDMTEKEFFQCGNQVGVRFADVNLYFSCGWSMGYSGLNPSVECTAAHVQLNPKSVLTLVQE